MFNDIKLTAFNPATAAKSEPKARLPVQEEAKPTASDVTLTPQLGKLASALSETDEVTSEQRSEKLTSLKAMLQNDDYKIDINTLARRLGQSPLMN